MNRQEIQLLQRMRLMPSVTITMPTHRTSPDNKQDPIRLKNLTTEAVNRLLKDFSKRDIEPLLGRLRAVTEEIDHEYNLDGLAIFVNRDFSRTYRLPFKLKERVVVDDQFHTRDLVFAMNRSPRYWVLVLSEKPTRLYEAVRDDLEEVTDGLFPMKYTGPGADEPLPGGFGIEPSIKLDRYHEAFFREVDREFDRVTKSDPAPLVLVGVDYYLSTFNKVATKNDLIAEVRGNYDRLNAHDLGRLVWRYAEPGFQARSEQALRDLEAAVGARRYASTIGEVWRYAHEGRVATVLVEENFHAPARLSEDGMNIVVSDKPEDLNVMDDATDFVVEETLLKGGRVVFVPDGTLAQHGRVAAILRY